MLADYFARKAPAIFWPSDIPRLLRDAPMKCHDLGLSGEQLLQFLYDEKLLVKAEFGSSNYPTIVRYLSGSHSPFELATSLRRRSFLCHRTALVVHGLAHSSEPIYVNQEQSPKPAPEDIQPPLAASSASRSTSSNTPEHTICFSAAKIPATLEFSGIKHRMGKMWMSLILKER
jgi:hypothetical protein